MSYLHEDKKAFLDAIGIAMRVTGFSAQYIEKDYYASLILKDLSAKYSDLAFKGGTALSKVYGAIERFSEDLDVSFTVHAGSGRRRTLKHKAIIPICNKYGFVITNLDEAISTYDVVAYNIAYTSVIPAGNGKPIPQMIKLETSHIQPITKASTRYVGSYIGSALQQISPQWVIKYNLQPFPMLVQDMDLTFVDKVFAVCDYFLRNRPKRNSRHIYDLHALLPHIPVNKTMYNFIQKVRTDRAVNPRSLSAQPGADVPAILRQIYNTRFYEQDYYTTLQLFPQGNPVSYAAASQCLLTIADSHLFDNPDTNKKNIYT